MRADWTLRLIFVSLVACSSSESPAPVAQPDAGTDSGTTTPDASTDVDPSLACRSGKECPGAVCCRDAAYGTTPIGGSRCMPDCFTNLPRVQMCATGETCQNGKTCQVFPSSCEGRAHPEQLYCEPPDPCE